MLEFDIRIQSEDSNLQIKIKGDRTMFEIGKAVLKNRKGQGSLEYGLIASLISIAAIVILRLLGPQLVIFFTAAKDAF